MTEDIVFLDGVSSAGKSSIAKALQALLPDPFLHVGGIISWACCPDATWA